MYTVSSNFLLPLAILLFHAKIQKAKKNYNQNKITIRIRISFRSVHLGKHSSVKIDHLAKSYRRNCHLTVPSRQLLVPFERYGDPKEVFPLFVTSLFYVNELFDMNTTQKYLY